jgi:F-type H+-transporting ATPase subunit delta
LNDIQSARRYARAIIETATDSQAVRDELLAIGGAFKTNPALLEALANPAVPVATKKTIFAAIFSGLTAPLPRLFDMLIDAARVDLTEEIVRRYRDEWNARNNVHVAKVIAAMPLDADAIERVRRALETAVSGKVELETTTDPSLVGGLKVEVDGHLFDGTVKARLKALRQRLL